MGQDIGMQVMPMIDLDGKDWNTAGSRIPDWGMGAQEGYESCRKKCGLD